MTSLSTLLPHVFSVSITQSVQINADGGMKATSMKSLVRSDNNSTLVALNRTQTKPFLEDSRLERISTHFGSVTSLIASAAKLFFTSRVHLRDSRPAIAFFTDSECSKEMGGFYLPAEAHILHDTCFPVSHRNLNEAAWTSKNDKDNPYSTVHMSMLWQCTDDDGGVNIWTSTNGDCINHIDDTWSFHVESFRLAHLAGGRCVSVMNEGAFQVVYVKLYNTH